MAEIVYSADSQLRTPLRFCQSLLSDLYLSLPVAWMLFLRNLQAGYRQSWLGYFWLLLPPLATTITWVYLNHAKVFEVGKTNVPYPIYVLTGTLFWQVFMDGLNSPLQQLTASRNIITKSKIPHEALMLAGIIEVLFNFVIRLAVTLPVLIWLHFTWSPTLLLVPIGVISLLLLGFTIGLLVAPLGLLYNDVSRALIFISGFWFFLTPVIYPTPAGWPASLLSTFNPVTPILTTTRDWLTLGTLSPAPGFIVVVFVTLICLGVAWTIYRLARPHLVARL